MRFLPYVPLRAVPVSALVGLAAGLGLSIPLARGDAKSATIPVTEIKEGMKGYGLSVFHGTTPERFDVEVIGILHNFLPAQDLILIKTPNNPRLDVAKVVHGMSGSPIYLDGGRLAGAYSYSYTNFPAEPVCGATPIAPMLTELHRAIPPGFWPSEGGAPLPTPTPPGQPLRPASLTSPASSGGPTSFEGEPGSYDLEAHAAQIAKRMSVDRSSGIVPIATPLVASGFTSQALTSFRRLVEPLGFDAMQGGGGGTGVAGATNAPEHYVNGGVLGVVLVSGPDVSMAGWGTATYVEGKRVAGWGHPWFEAGNIAIPAAIGNVLWIHAGISSSSKILEMARPLGAIVQDRQSAVVIDEAKTAPTFPIAVNVKGVTGANKTSWTARVAEERFMSPGLVSAVIGSAVGATTSEHRDVTWRLDSKVTVRGHGEIALEDFGVAVGGMPDSGDFGRTRVVRSVGDIVNNPWEFAHVEKVESVLTVQYTRDVWRLRGVEALEDTVDAGSSARIVLHLVPFAGPEITKTVDVKMPEELAGKDVDVEVVPGYESYPDLPAPEDLNELLANETRQSAVPRSVVVQFRIPSEGVTFHGHVAPRLPPFALDALRPAHSDVGPEPFYSYARTTVAVEQYVEGHDHTHVKVRAVVR